MLMSQVLVAFYAIIHNPGETLEGLAKIIYETYGDQEAVQFMMTGNQDNELLKSRIDEINAVVMRDGHYQYDSNIKPLAKDPMLSYFLQYQLDAEAERLKKSLSKPAEGG